MDDSFLLDREQIQRDISPLWSLIEHPHLQLQRSFTARNFQCALDFLNQAGAIAERENHHPDLHITNYREVTLQVSTHKLKGVTENDLQLMRMMDEEIKVDYSPKWLKEHPEAKDTAVAKES